jgi:H+/Cl- antiporter ClcA
MNFSPKNKENISPKLSAFFNWIVMVLSAAAVGAICGVTGGAFARSISFVTELRAEHEWLVFALPFGGLVSVALYKLTKTEGIGTDRVLESATGAAKTPVWLVPAVFVSSVITHLFGGSAGKEGAALQIGGGAAELVSKLVKADVKLHSVLTMCGMAALFSAVFGTPVGACVFALEVAAVGEINALAILPAMVASVISRFISNAMGVNPESFNIGFVPDI